MDTFRLAGVALAAAAVGGAAWGQAGPKPSYDGALTAVIEGGCQRTQAERYVRYFCEEGEAFWYFTHEGRPEHAAYFVAPAYRDLPDRFASNFGHGDPYATKNREEAQERMKAWLAWQRDIIEISKADAASMPRQRRGKRYPLEPQ
jgi:hypothetical protein